MDFARPVGVVDLLRIGVWNPRFRKSDRKSCVREEMCLAFEGGASTWVRGVGAEMSYLGLADTMARVAFLASRQRTGGFCGFTWPSRDLVKLWAACELEWLESEILPSVSQQRRSSSTTGSASVAGGFAWTSHDHIEVRVLSELGFGIREPR